MNTYLELARSALTATVPHYEINELDEQNACVSEAASTSLTTKETKQTKEIADDGWDWIAAELEREGMQLVDVDSIWAAKGLTRK